MSTHQILKCYYFPYEFDYDPDPSESKGKYWALFQVSEGIYYLRATEENGDNTGELFPYYDLTYASEILEGIKYNSEQYENTVGIEFDCSTFNPFPLA